MSDGGIANDRSTLPLSRVDVVRRSSWEAIGVQVVPHRHGAARRDTAAPMSAPVKAWRVAFDGCVVDMIDRQLRRSKLDRPRCLAGQEFDLSRVFIAQPYLTLSRRQLSQALVAAGHGQLSPRTVDSYVCRLRRKLGSCGSQVIRTVRGRGYAFEADVSVN